VKCSAVQAGGAMDHMDKIYYEITACFSYSDVVKHRNHSRERFKAINVNFGIRTRSAGDGSARYEFKPIASRIPSIHGLFLDVMISSALIISTIIYSV
jgi:hypothetical protein